MGLIYHARDFQYRPSCHVVAPIEDENTDSEIVPPLVKGVRGI